MLEINLTKNTNTTSKCYGLVYGEVDWKEMYDLNKLAKHMHEHSCNYTVGTIKGVLEDMVKCIRHLCLDGNKVKIADLAIFKCQVESKGAASFLAYDIAKHVKNIRLAAQSTGEFRRAELNKDGVLGYSSLAESLREAERPKPEPEPDDDDDNG